MNAENNSFVIHFGGMTEPRLTRKMLHSLINIVTITVLGVIAGAEGWTEVERFGKAKQAWLSTFLELPNGIPSHDTFGRFFSLLNPVEFQQAFINWTKDIHEKVEGSVAFDGKSVRRSHDAGKDKRAIHIVSAWATANGISLGQVKVDDKSNEITAIPELLKLIDVKDCLVTSDAMGCQREIAKAVVEAGGDYLLAVKGNQETLQEDIQQEFKEAQAENFAHMDYEYHETLDKGHGRIEHRQYWYTSDVQGLGTLEQWPELSAMVMCRSTRTVKGKTSVEDRYFITSNKRRPGKTVATAIRAHWGIENKLHWVLDIAFSEDQCRIRTGYAAENFATIRKLALTALNDNKSRKGGVRAKRLQAAWDTDYLRETFMLI
jgi:predicted transposase YbfD/YdcC